MGKPLQKVIALLFVFVTVSVNAQVALPNLKVKQLTDNVYLFNSYAQVNGFGVVSSNGLVVVKGDEAFLIDTPWSVKDTKDLMQWIKEQGLTLKGSISTHSHDDRTAGIDLLKRNNVPTYASKMTNDFLFEQGKQQASFSFHGNSTTLFDGLLEAFYAGPGHTDDNIVIWLNKEKILFGGCMVKSLTSKGLGNIADADLKRWPHSIDAVLSRYNKIQLVVPGHGKIGDSTLLTHTKSLLEK